MSEVKRVELDGIGKTEIDQFLVPEAMLTPGVAGSMIVLISNALSINFELNYQQRGYLGLALSFVFGLLIINRTKKWIFRMVYYVANSFIIFAIAFGANTLASVSES
jgi:presenilin-like A22 family membrane protease